MTLARVLCGSCGGALRITDEHCPHCGASVELPGREVPVASIPSKEVPASPRRSRPRNESSSKKRGSGSTRLWQGIAIGAVALTLGVLAWSELSREQPASSTQLSTPAPIPAKVDLAPLERAVAENPDDVHAKLTLANALQDNGVYSRAIELYKDYLGVHADDPNARVDLGICYFELARTDSVHSQAFLELAIKEMTAAFQGTKEHQPAAFNLGIVYLTAGNLEESNRWFERAAALDSTSALGQRARQMLDQHRMISQ